MIRKLSLIEPYLNRLYLSMFVSCDICDSNCLFQFTISDPIRDPHAHVSYCRLIITVGNCRLSGHIQTIYCLICWKIARSVGNRRFRPLNSKKKYLIQAGADSFIGQFHLSFANFSKKKSSFSLDYLLTQLQGLFFSSTRTDPPLQNFLLC